MSRSGTAVVTLNLTRQLNESFINSRFVVKRNPEKKDKRHISFLEQVKFFYFDFDQPISMPLRRELEMKNLNYFYSKNDAQLICTLESFKLKNYNKNTIENLIRLEGTVLVKNFAYEKKVTVRYSLTEWKTFSDIEGFYIDSLNNEYDRFAFVIRIDPILFTYKDHLIISLAIRYEALKTVCWDNNCELNHRFMINMVQNN